LLEDLDRPSLEAYRRAAGRQRQLHPPAEGAQPADPDRLGHRRRLPLFAEHPQRAIPPRARADPAVPRRTPGTGRRFTLDDARDQRIEGPIPTMIERAAEIIEARVPRRRALGTSGTF